MDCSKDRDQPNRPSRRCVGRTTRCDRRRPGGRARAGGDHTVTFSEGVTRQRPGLNTSGFGDALLAAVARRRVRDGPIHSRKRARPDGLGTARRRFLDRQVHTRPTSEHARFGDTPRRRSRIQIGQDHRDEDEPSRRRRQTTASTRELGSLPRSRRESRVGTPPAPVDRHGLSLSRRPRRCSSPAAPI